MIRKFGLLLLMLAGCTAPQPMKGLLTAKESPGAVAAASSWYVETGFECLGNGLVPAINFSRHGTTFSIADSSGGSLSVANGTINTGEPNCLSDEMPSIVLRTSKHVSQITVNVIPEMGTPQVFAIIAYYRTGYSGPLYYYEYPMIGNGIEYSYTYAPNRIAGFRVKGAILDSMRIDYWDY